MLHRNKLLTLIKSLGGSIFNITWVKKDGTIRNANVRRHVNLFNSGRPSPAHSLGSSYVLVYLVPKMEGNTFTYETGWRLVNLETVTQINAKGKQYDISPEPITEIIDLSTTTIEQPNNVIAISA